MIKYECHNCREVFYFESFVGTFQCSKCHDPVIVEMDSGKPKIRNQSDHIPPSVAYYYGTNLDPNQSGLCNGGIFSGGGGVGGIGTYVKFCRQCSKQIIGLSNYCPHCNASLK